MPTAAPDPFRALADPTRRAILGLLSERDMTVAQVSARFEMTRAAVRKHLLVLEQGNLIATRREGRETYSKLNAEGLQPVQDWLSYFHQFWDDRLSALSEAIETDTHAKDTS